LVSQTQSGILIASYTYDSQNRMVEAKTYGISGTLTETYNYDALGNRIAKTTDGVKTEYVIDYSTGYAQVLRATTDANTIFYTRGFELISRKDATRELWYLTDGGGSVRFLTDSTGSVTDSLVFDAFGNTVSRAGQTGDSYGFQGEQQDATGLYYLRARYMNPATGSFTQMDTYGGSLSDPISLHKYLFANANPVKYRDPSGHMGTQVDTLAALSMQMILFSCISMTIYSIGYFGPIITGKQTFVLDQFISGLGRAGIKGLLFGALAYMSGCVLAVVVTSFYEGLQIAAILSLLGRFSYDMAQYFYNNGNYYGAAAMQVLGDALNIFALNAIFAGLGTLGNSSNQAASGAGGGKDNSWYNADGSINYPPNNGGISGSEEVVKLQPGRLLGRYGDIGPNSDFVTDPGASPDSLSLPPTTSSSVYTEIVVLKPIPGVIQSTVAPWGGSSGMGIQYQLPKSLEVLKAEGYIYY